MIIVTDSMKNGMNYNGNTRKFGISISNSNYIVKFAKDNDLSVYCEYIASNFIRSIGICCQSVSIGIYNNEVVDIIFDFASNYNLYLHSFKDSKQSSFDTDISDKEYTYKDVLYLLDKHIKLTEDNKIETKNRFWQMFICDAILGNRDRHWGNWGYLGSDKSDHYVPAPIYDNGASLYPGVHNSINGMLANKKKFMYDRVMTFPASLFKIKRPDRSYRTNYYEMFSDLRFNRILAEQTKSIRSRFSYKQIFYIAYNIINNPDINVSVLIKKFWVEIITLRYMCIICRVPFEEAYNAVEKEMRTIEKGKI